MTFSGSTLACVMAGAICVLSAGEPQAAPLVPTVVHGAGSTSGGLFTAGPDGAEWLLPSQTTLRLSPHGVMRVFARPQSLELEPGPKTPTWSVALSRGRLDVQVPAKPRSALLASIDRVSAVVTSGSATVLAEPGVVSVANSGGAVRTYIEGRWTTVEVGHLSQIDAEHGFGADSALLASPSFSKGPRIWFTGAEPARVAGFEWGKVDGAVSYDLELRQGTRVVGSERVEETKLAHELARIEPGEYQLAVRSVDARGIEGRWSEALALRAIGVELPPGGYLENGGIFLSGGQKVHFSRTEGLEMTYLGAGKYVPANEEVGLYRNQRTIVSFRYPHSTEDTVARLEPRDVYADVFAGPKLATWPRDPVTLRVRLRTRAGAPVPAFIEVVPTVMVGVEPLSVSWQKDGDELRAVVPPQASRGPWVIRVDVADQFGIALGRDFVEIAEQKPKLAPGASRVAGSAGPKRLPAGASVAAR